MKRILVIDDDPDTLEIMEFVFKITGYKVIISSRKLSVKEVIKKNPSLILLDYFLGEDPVGDFCLELKANPQTKQIPVIIMSAHDDVEPLAMDCYADAYIAKPFDIDILEKLVREKVNR